MEHHDNIARYDPCLNCSTNFWDIWYLLAWIWRRIKTGVALWYMFIAAKWFETHMICRVQWCAVKCTHGTYSPRVGPVWIRLMVDIFDSLVQWVLLSHSFIRLLYFWSREAEGGDVCIGDICKGDIRVGGYYDELVVAMVTVLCSWCSWHLGDVVMWRQWGACVFAPSSWVSVGNWILVITPIPTLPS